MAARLGTKAFKIVCPSVLTLGGLYASIPVAFADSKRVFYENEDEEFTTPIPGTILSPTPDDIKTLKPPKIISGVTVRSPSSLEGEIKKAREWTAGKVSNGEQQLDTYFNEYYGIEKSVSTTLAELRDDNEDILPGALYGIVGVIAGSVITRRRGIMLRALAPFTLGFIAIKYFLPKTSSNIAALSWEIEKLVPVVSNTHQWIYDKTVSGIKKTQVTYTNTTNIVKRGVDCTREAVAKSTGLKIDEVKNSNDEKK